MEKTRPGFFYPNLFPNRVKLPELHLWRDSAFRSVSLNMALDETLFHWTAKEGVAVARFYHWDHEAVTVGYFDRSYLETEDTRVRRFTGGGLVEHGEDLTFLLAFPGGSASALAATELRYRWIHEALADALTSEGFPVALQGKKSPSSPGPCFVNPVPWDLLDPKTGIKIGGGAQRRSRGAVIHQGSIRLPLPLRDPMAGWIDRFVETLAETVCPLDEPVRDAVLRESDALEKSRYGSKTWNRGGRNRNEVLRLA